MDPALGIEEAPAKADAPRIMLRPLRPDDGPALERLGRNCSAEDLRLRFFHMVGEADRRLRDQLTRLDPHREEAHIAFEPGSRIPLGVVRLHGDREGQTAEFAVLVRTNRQGRGLGRRLMEFIIEAARRRGFRAVCGQILPENARMLALCRSLGFDLRSTPGGIVLAWMELTAPRETDPPFVA